MGSIRYRIYQVEILVQQISEDLPHVSVPLNNEGENRPVSGQIYQLIPIQIALRTSTLKDSYCKMESLPLKLRQGQGCWAWNVVFKIEFNKQLGDIKGPRLSLRSFERCRMMDPVGSQKQPRDHTG